MSKTSTCLLKHFGASSPIVAYRKDMAGDVEDLIADGMESDAAWMQVAEAKLKDLRAERARIEQVVADAYAKTPAGTPPPAAPPAAPPAPPAPTPAELRKQEIEARRVARETERNVYRDLGAREDMIGKTVAQLETAVRAQYGDVKVDDDKVSVLARALHKLLAKKSVELAKQKHRDPQILAAAVKAAYPALPADPSPEAALAFKGGFEHAVAGKTKSTLSGDKLPQMIFGYEAGQRWLKTEEGMAFYEGRPLNKLQNTGVDLKRVMDQLKANMKAGESDIKKAWAQIERATVRADLFAPLLPEGVTPGYRTYIEGIRANVNPFKAWLEGAYNWYGAQSLRGRYSSSDKTNIDYVLDGERLPDTLTKEDKDKFRSDPGYRAEWLRDAANAYITKVHSITSLLEKTSSVDEAARKWSDRYFARDEINSGKGDRNWALNDAGKEMDSYKNRPFWAEHSIIMANLRRHSDWTQHLVENEKTIALPDRATPLTPPKLDRVTRDGPDVRQGKNSTPAEVKARYKFADIGFGNWVGAKQDQDHLNYADDAFSDLSKHFGAPMNGIGFGGRLHLTIGALGHGKFAAHFTAGQPGPDGTRVEVINLTNTKGDGTVYHEWVHALDHFLMGDWKSSVRGKMLAILKQGAPTIEQVETRAFDFLFGGAYWTGSGGRLDKVANAMRIMHRANELTRQTAYKTNADQLGKDYWGNDAELLARAGEAWAADTLGHTNTYLVNPKWVGDGMVTKAKGYRGTPYPTGAERQLFNKLYAALAKSVTWENGKPAVKAEDFEANMPVELTEGYARAKELQARPAMEELQERERARRELVAAQKAEEKAATAREEQEEIDRLAAQALADLKQPELDSPPVSETKGPLSDDDLSAMFDEAAAELREGAQEDPKIPPPPSIAEEPAPPPPVDGSRQAIFQKWTQEDLQEILDKANDPDKVAIAGDPIWNVPDIHEIGRMGKTVFFGDGMFETSGTDAAGKPWSMTWDGGGAMKHTTDGRSWTNVGLSGNTPYPSGVRRAIEAARDLKAAQRREAPVKAPPPEASDATAAQLIADAAKLGVKGANEALTGLAKLFGGGKGRLNSFPAGFDEETYKEAKPHFQAALAAFQEAGKSLKDLFKMLIAQFGDGIKEYAIRFAKDEALTAQLGSGPSASMQIAEKVRQRLSMGHSFDWRVLFEWSDAAFGGTQAEGKYTPRDAYDAVEAGMNRYLMAHPGTYTPAANREAAQVIVADLQSKTELLPTQTKRTAEQDEFQQFSTVPALAFMANWVANVNATDVMLEPSAGNGGLGVFAHNAGAKLVLNELSSRRAAVLQEVLPSARVFHEDAAQIDNILPDDIKPSVVVMNPPFSSAAGRGIKSTKDIGGGHIEQAMERLVSGGRLVAIGGEGMGLDRPAFAGWWKKMREKYDVRAVIPLDGKGYAKYGTTFDNVLIVIDKVSPKEGREPVVTPASDYTQLIGLLSEIRDDRPNARIVANDRDAVERDTAESALGQPGAGPQPGDAGAGGPAGVGGGEPLPESAGRGNAPGGGGAGGGRGPGNGVRAPSGRPDAGGNLPGSGGGTTGQQDAGTSGVSITSETTQAAALTDSVFEGYTPQRLQIPGAKPHPGPLVESSAMASVLPPHATYTPNLPKKTIEDGLLSLAQLESVVYAGQAHEQMLQQTVSETQAEKLKTKAGDKFRRGFFIGDGTGVGKGREIGGIILDNLRQGRKRHVWVSEKQGLMKDAKRDFQGVGGDEKKIFNQNASAADADIPSMDGILFTTYATLRSSAQTTLAGGFKKGDPVQVGRAFGPPGSPDFDTTKLVKVDNKKHQVTVEWSNGQKVVHPFAQILSINGDTGWVNSVRDRSKLPPSRLDQIVKWLGPDFDGVIAFDEAHNAGNAIEIKGAMGTTSVSAQAEAVVELQNRLPNARVVYVSATGATEVSNLSFATRLGLWGMGTPFPSVSSFVDKMTAGGLATMELVARDMKQMGAYLARSLSYDGVSYSRVDHELTPLQTDIYDKLADSWQIVLQNMMEALKLTGVVSESGKAKNGKALAAAKSAFWGSQQRFFNQIITSMQMPTVLDQIERDLKAGDAVVLQLVNTNEAQLERSLAAQKKGSDEEEIEDLDLTPRDQLLQMVEKAFPVQQMEDYMDLESGRRKTRPVVSADGTPVLNKQAVALRDRLLQDLKDIRVPDGPLEQILNTFGPEITAEITGRKQRVISSEWNTDAEAKAAGKMMIQKRGGAAARADAEAFMEDKKRILVFSDAGGTGFSFHADLKAKNQRKRKHYLIQPGWRANKAVQGLGRTHRSNQKQPPHFVLASTNIPAHKRFLSSIARRLDQLGALTKGQRDTSSGGLFTEKDNLESQYATEAVRRLFKEAQQGAIEGIVFADLLKQLGLEDIVNPDTQQIAEKDFPATTQFLNRMLSLRLDMQEKVFTAFSTRMEEQVALAEARGTLDTGMQTIRALESKILQEETIYVDERTGAETQYIELELKKANKFFEFPQEKSQGSKIDWLKNAKSGRVWARVRSGNTTLKNGSIVERYRMFGTGGMQIRNATDFQIDQYSKKDNGHYLKLDEDQARTLWDEENAVRPQTYVENAHMIVGAMLPIWDRLQTEGAMQVARTQTVDNRRLLGRVIAQKDVAELLKRLNITSLDSKLPADKIMARLLKGEIANLANGWTLERAKVSDELRIEIKGRSVEGSGRELVNMGVIQERISWNNRYFIPVNKPEILAALLANKPLVELVDPKAEKGESLSLAERVNRMQAERAKGASLMDASSENMRAVEGLSKKFQAQSPGLSGFRAVVGIGKDANPGLQAVATVAKRFFNHEVVFVKFDGKPFFNGMVSSTYPNKIFVNVESNKPFMSVLGHELLHKFEDKHPDLYEELKGRIDQVLKNPESYYTKLAEKYTAAGMAVPSTWMEELHGDIVGDFFTEPQFWRDLAADQSDLFSRIAKAILTFLDNVLDKLSEYKPYGTDQYLKDVKAARSAVVDAMQAFSEPLGTPGVKAPPGESLSIADTVASRVSHIRSIDQKKVRDAFADMVGSGGAKVGWISKTLGTQYAKAERFPAYKRVFERVQSYIEDVSTLSNEAADKAPSILPKLENWKDLRSSFKSFGLSATDSDAIAVPIFQGTLEDMKVYSDAELRDQFRLSPKQIGQYRQFNNAVNTSLDQILAADVLKLLGDKNPALRELALADRDAMRSGIDDYLTQQIQDGAPGEKQAMLELRTDIRKKYERIDQLKAEGYAPLMRFGKFKVSITDQKSGESLFFGLYETADAANKMARTLATDPTFAKQRIEQGVLSEEQYKLFSSVPVESMEMFAEAIGAEKSEVFQAYLRLAKNNRSALKRLIKRKGTAGFSEDVSRVLAAFVTSNARLSASAMNLSAAKSEIETIRDGDVKDEAIKLVESVQNPKETAAAARGLMFMNFIGGSIASAVVNLTQPITMTLPYLSQFGGLSKATSRLMDAGRMAASGKADSAELREALKRAEDDGIVSPQEIHHLTAQAMGANAFGNTALAKQAAFIWAAPFSLAEQFNRRVSFIAAYKTAQAEGIENPFAFAEKAVVETQGLYNKGNMPNLSRTPIGAVALQFKQFSIHYLEWMMRMWNAGEPGSAERAAGRRAVLIALALLMVAAGTDGLPFLGDIDDLIDTIGQALGYNTNAKKIRRDFVAKTLGFGDETADVAARGLSAFPGIPLDVSLRMSMGNLIPATGIMLRSNTDRSRDLLEIAGPGGGMAKQYLDAAQKGLAGDVAGMARGAAPIAAQNVLKAIDMWQSGEARDTKGRRVMEADAVDSMMRFLGFNPQSIARESEKLGMIYRSEQLAKNVEAQIMDKWARGFADKDPDAVRAARADLAEWNASNPEARIAITTAQVIQRVKKLRQDRSQRFITSVSPERRAAVRAELN